MEIVRIGKHNAKLQRYWSIVDTWLPTDGAEKLLAGFPFEYAYVYHCGGFPIKKGQVDPGNYYACYAALYCTDLEAQNWKTALDAATIFRENILRENILTPEKTLYGEIYITTVEKKTLLKIPELMPMEPRRTLLKFSATLQKLNGEGGNWFWTPFTIK